MSLGSALSVVCAAALMGCSSAAPPAAFPTVPQAESLTVTVHEGTELTAALSPDGRRVAFILLGQTWLVDAEGGRATPVTNVVDEPGKDWFIAWAPDSRRLAVWSSARLSVIDVPSRTTLRRWAVQGWATPVWYASGDRILAAELRAGADSTIMWSFPLDGSQTPVPLRTAPRGMLGLSFSPDGRTLAYAAPVTVTLIPTTASDIWQMEMATGEERRLTSDSTLDAYPAYSPDGRWLAFLSERSGSRQIWLIAPSGGGLRPLTTQAEEIELAALTWLPDSRGVVYTAAGKIRVARIDGGSKGTIEFAADLRIARWRSLRRPQLMVPGERRQVRGVVTPELSPNGRQVAFAALGDLWVANVSGGSPRRLTRTPADEMRPRWSPDGSRLAYVVNAQNSERQVRILEVEHPERTQSTQVPTASWFYQFAWSPDGRHIAYVDDNGRVGRADLLTGRLRVVFAPARGPDPPTLLAWTVRGDSIVASTGRRVFESAGTRVDWTVWELSADSGTATRMAVPSEYVERGAWSADLSRAAYAIFGSGYHAALRERTRPAPIPDPAPRFFSWSADGNLLLYLSGSRLRMLDVRGGEPRTVDLAVDFRAPPAPPPLLVRNVRIVDGTGGPASGPVDVLIAQGRIASISPRGVAPPPAGGRVIDAAGRTLLPGLINLHAHQMPSKLFLAAHLYHGTTSIRDPSIDAEWMQAQRERVDAGEVLGPRIFATGGVFVPLRGVANLNARSVNPAEMISVANEVRSVAAVGADIIKPYFLSPRNDASVSEAAHAVGLPMTSHSVFLSSLARGLEGKEHSMLYYRDLTAPYRQDVVTALRAANTCVTSSLLVYAASFIPGRSRRFPLDSTFFHDAALLSLYPPSVLAQARAALRRPLPEPYLVSWRQREGWDFASMLRLKQAGVRVATGTDVNSPFDEAGVPLEAELLVAAGFSPLEAIRAATLDAASCLGVESELGSVEVGKRADLIIVDGDPATDIRDLRRVAWVVLGGAAYTRQEILSSVRGAGFR